MTECGSKRPEKHVAIHKPPHARLWPSGSLARLLRTRNKLEIMRTVLKLVSNAQVADTFFPHNFQIFKKTNFDLKKTWFLVMYLVNGWP